jgi:hypothetical protein
VEFACARQIDLKANLGDWFVLDFKKLALAQKFSVKIDTNLTKSKKNSKIFGAQYQRAFLPQG